MEERNIYKDIAERTQGDIYIGDEVFLGQTKDNRMRTACFKEIGGSFAFWRISHI